MKNLEIFLDDNTKVFEAIISNNYGVIKSHDNVLMPELLELVNSVISGEYKIEFENRILDTSLADNIFDRIEIFKSGENFRVDFNTVSPLKILDYVYQNEIPYLKDIQYIVDFFDISLNKTDDIKGIGEALSRDNKFIINYKEQYYKQRERFTIAHELGHIFLHFSTDKKKHFEDFDKELEVANNTSYKNDLKAARGDLSNYDRELENEANSFAEELIIPKFQLEHLVNQYIETYKQKPFMSTIKRAFNVSNGTAFYALRDANLMHNVIDDCRPW